MFDVNISYGNWPFQNFSEYTPDYLIAHLKKNGITGGLISSIDAVFQDDLDFQNRNLISLFQFVAPKFIPIVTVNPKFTNMMEMLEELSPKAVRLIPNYHTFPLNSPKLAPLASWCLENNVLIVIPRRMQDERSHHHCCRVPGVSLDEIAEFAARHSKLKILCNNLYFHETAKFAEGPENVHVDISNIETSNTLGALLNVIETKRVLFGSNTPFFYTKAAVMKVEAAEIPLKDKFSISEGNAAGIAER